MSWLVVDRAHVERVWFRRLLVGGNVSANHAEGATVRIYRLAFGGLLFKVNRDRLGIGVPCAPVHHQSVTRHGRQLRPWRRITARFRRRARARSARFRAHEYLGLSSRRECRLPSKSLQSGQFLPRFLPRAMSTSPGVSMIEAMDKHRNTNGSEATSAQLWRLNRLGILELRKRPGDPLDRRLVKKLLGELAAEGLWQPKVRAGKK
jgi:hypothetical protein